MNIRHCIEPTDLSRAEVEQLISLAKDMIAHPNMYKEVCRGRKLATLFYEPSTRTRLSFTAAMMDLGGEVIGFADAKSSSVSKGETVADTIRVVSNYVDIVAMRHYKEGAPLVASQYGSVPVINAGDGSHSHPTQTLTDLLTISRELGRLDNLVIGLCGDLKYGRTVHSLINALSMFEGIHFVLISPDNLKLPDYMLSALRESKNITYTESKEIESVISSLDVLYMTRVQRERFEDEQEYERCKDCFILDSNKMSIAKDKMIVLHPLPRVNEIHPEVDNDYRAAYFRQVGNGKFIRMALIYTLINIAEREKIKSVVGNELEFTNQQVPVLSSNYEKTEKVCSNPVCISNSEPLFRLQVNKDGHILCPYCDNLIV